MPLKKGDIYEGVVEKVAFPNKGIVRTPEGKIRVKQVLPGQTVRVAITKKRSGDYEGRLLEVTLPAPNETSDGLCAHAGVCGGCGCRSLPYEDQLLLKQDQVRALMEPVVGREFFEDGRFEGVLGSPRENGYRNKMEYSFGDEYKDGPLTLGLHKKGSFYDIVTVEDCRIADGDFSAILSAVLAYFTERGTPYYHKMRKTGVLRHLVVRKAVKTGELLVNLVTTSAYRPEEDFVRMLLDLPLTGRIAGILHTANDSYADAVINEGLTVLYGRDHFYEELLGLRFKISPFSFFQTNSLGAELLYAKAREYLGSSEGKVVFDLYSGTGTIAQVLAPAAAQVIGVEIVEEAVEAARVNAAMNGLDNCRFLAGDVFKCLDEIETRPDYIVLDPPRDGVSAKALQKIMAYGVPRMVYISCKPTSLARDLELLKAGGYEVVKMACVDMFPGSMNIETVCLLSRMSNRKPDSYVKITLDMEEYYKIVEAEKGELNGK